MQMIIKNTPFTAIRIKDGLFIGDARAANFKDFILANKISTIINCSSGEVQISGVFIAELALTVLNYNWKDSDSEIILDSTDKCIVQICNYIEKAEQQYQTVLISCLEGRTRSLSILTAVLMSKYKWTLYKTLEYLNSKSTNFEIRAAFLNQIISFESRLIGSGARLTYNWKEPEADTNALLLRNTFLNSLKCKSIFRSLKKKTKNKRVNFSGVLFQVIQSEHQNWNLSVQITSDEFEKEYNLITENSSERVPEKPKNKINQYSQIFLQLPQKLKYQGQKQRQKRRPSFKIRKTPFDRMKTDPREEKLDPNRTNFYHKYQLSQSPSIKITDQNCTQKLINKNKQNFSSSNWRYRMYMDTPILNKRKLSQAKRQTIQLRKLSLSGQVRTQPIKTKKSQKQQLDTIQIIELDHTKPLKQIQNPLQQQTVTIMN